MSKVVDKEKIKQQRALKKDERKKNSQIVIRTLKFMFGVAIREKTTLFMAFFLLFITTLVAKAVNIILPKFLIDELTIVYQGPPTIGHIKKLVLIAGLICGINLITNIISSLAMQYKTVLSEWFNEHLQLMLSDKSMKMDFEHTEDPKVLDSLARAKEGIGWYSGGVEGILDYFLQIIMNITVLFGVGAIIFVTCPLLLPIQLVSLLLIGFFNAKNNAVEAKAYGKLAKINRIFGYYLFRIANFEYGKEIRLYNSTDMMIERASKASDEMALVWAESARGQRKYRWYMDATNAVRDGISYFYIGFLAIKKVISVGDFAMCVSAASEMYQGMFGLVRNCQEVIKRCNYAYKFIEFLDYPDTLEKGDKKVKEGDHVISFEHVSFKYPRSDSYVLKDINITVKPGEHLSIVGLNGAGKTTFIKLLCRLYDVTEGVIRIDGTDIREYSQEEYRKLFAVVFQDYKLFAFSLKENIAFDNEAKDDEIDKIIEMAGLTDDVKGLSKGADTIIYKSYDEDGTALSGGQQQKTAIGRALYRNAPVVILDEPTAALDPIAEYDIYRSFDTLVGGKTAIYISHRLSSCRFCDRIAVFADNTIKEYGTHAELVNKKDGIYANMFAAQAQYYVEAV